MIVYLLMMACVSVCALICFVGNVSFELKKILLKKNSSTTPRPFIEVENDER